MSASAPENSYLDEVIQNQQAVDQQLKRKVRSAMPGAPAAARPAQGARLRVAGPAPEVDAGGRSVDYRITGFFRWQTVVVPPNVYVVHTRRGSADPLHIGMGISFHYNPYTDAFLVIPAAMQTIVINARCIGAERQGILVQAYVQWIIDDIATAYRRLDFSDADDPMGIVNIQLREQAEAAIKDKVSTMRIDEVLADKQPIIEELTTRLRTVAEGSRAADAGNGGAASGGLGLKIVTVQIKEAVVSSTRLWENLQKPFRAERDRLARLAELEAERLIAERELEIRQSRETAEIATAREIARRVAEQERETFDRAQAETERRQKVSEEAERAAMAERTATERARRVAELELSLQAMELEQRRIGLEIATLRERQKADAAQAERAKAGAEFEVALAELRSRAADAIAEREVAQFKARRAVENDLSEGHLRARLIEQLPEVAAKLPVPKELRAVSISAEAGGAAASLTGLVASVLALAGKGGEGGGGAHSEVKLAT